MAYYNGLYYELVKICDYCLANYQGQKEGGKKCFTHIKDKKKEGKNVSPTNGTTLP